MDLKFSICSVMMPLRMRKTVLPTPTDLCRAFGKPVLDTAQRVTWLAPHLFLRNRTTQNSLLSSYFTIPYQKRHQSTAMNGNRASCEREERFRALRSACGRKDAFVTRSSEPILTEQKQRKNVSANYFVNLCEG